MAPEPPDSQKPPPWWRRLLYRLHLGRLPRRYHDWILADLARPGVRARFGAAHVLALAGFWAVNVMLLGLPPSTGGPFMLLATGTGAVVLSDRGWRGIEASLLRRNGILTVEQVTQHRQGSGAWHSGRWYCDEHVRAFCRQCAPSSGPPGPVDRS